MYEILHPDSRGRVAENLALDMKMCNFYTTVFEVHNWVIPLRKPLWREWQVWYHIVANSV